MSFLYPAFLWGLLALAIPVVIHLFNFRKFKKVYFSNIELLKNVELETKSRSQLKHLIVLIIRMLVVAFLVFAFAQPFIPVEKVHKTFKNNTVAVFVDNSYSMDTRGENGYLLELAKEQAIHIAENYAATDRFHLITNELDPRHNRMVSRDEFIQLVEEVAPTYASVGLDNIYRKQQEAFEQVEGTKSCYWLSDFQKNAVDFNAVPVDTAVNIYLLPFTQQSKGNVYIDSVWFDTPSRKLNEEELLSVRVINSTDKPIEIKLDLSVNEILQGFGNFTIGENTSLDCTIPYTIQHGGLQDVKIELAEYPDPDLVFDDVFYCSYFVNETIRILEVNDQLLSDSITPIRKLFAKDNSFSYIGKTFSNVEFSQLNTYDLVIITGLNNMTDGLSTELIKYCEQGGSLLLFPGEDIDLTGYNAFLRQISMASVYNLDTNTTKVDYIESESPLYQNIFENFPKNMDLPKVHKHYPIHYTVNSNAEGLLKYQDGSIFFSKNKVEQGSFYFSTVSLNEGFSNFHKHAIFVATLLRIAEHSQPTGQLWFTVGEDNIINGIKNISNIGQVVVQRSGSEFEFIPEVRKNNYELSLLLYDQVKEAGAYHLNIGEQTYDGFSFNYSREESDFSFYNSEEISQLLVDAPMGKYIRIVEGAGGGQPVNVSAIAEGTKLWWTFVLVALILLGIETLLLRLWKTNKS